MERLFKANPLPRQGILMQVHKRRVEIDKRLARVEGHIRGVRRMLEEDKACPDILIQLAAVRAALDKVSQLILADHVETCVAKAIDEGRGDEAIMELKDAIARFF